MTLHFYATFVLVYDLLLIFAFSHKVVPVHFKSDWNLGASNIPVKIGLQKT